MPGHSAASLDESARASSGPAAVSITTTCGMGAPAPSRWKSCGGPAGSAVPAMAEMGAPTAVATFPRRSAESEAIRMRLMRRSP